MKLVLLILATVVCSVLGAPPKRSKRQAYELPDGADIIVGAIKTTFQCPGNGYYADMDNNCQIFHVCNQNGETMSQYSFMCGNQTVFNQFSITCAMPEDSIPCSESPSFFYTNERIYSGDPKQYFLTEDDFARAVPLIPSLYNSIVGGGGAIANTATGGRGRGR